MQPYPGVLICSQKSFVSYVYNFFFPARGDSISWSSLTKSLGRVLKERNIYINSWRYHSFQREEKKLKCKKDNSFGDNVRWWWVSLIPQEVEEWIVMGFRFALYWEALF